MDDDATNDKGAKMRQHQEESGGGLKDEILAHLRLVSSSQDAACQETGMKCMCRMKPLHELCAP